MQSLFLSWLNCSADTESHVNAVQQTSCCLAALRLVFFFFPEEMTTDGKNFSRSLIHFRHHALLLFIYSFIQYLSSSYYTWIFPGGSGSKGLAYNAYHVETRQILATGWLVLCSSRLLILTFHCRRPHFWTEWSEKFPQRMWNWNWDSKDENRVILAANKRLFQVEGQNLLRPGWLCKTV